MFWWKTMGEQEKAITRDTIILLKVLDAVKDLIAITEAVLDNPSLPQRRILKRKLKIVKERLPQTAGEIKTVVKRKETKQLNFSNLKDESMVNF